MIFHFSKTRKRQAIKVAINILILPLLLYIFYEIGKDKPNFEEIYAIVEKMTFAIAFVLIGILIWFLKSKEKFEIYVTKNEFYSYHPIFGEWCFSVHPKDIVAIEHHLHVGAGRRMTNINVHLSNGKKLQICPNYSFSRKSLYSALLRINPNIHLPDNPNVFDHKPTKETDKYVSSRFPLTTKIIKSILRIIPNKKSCLVSKIRGLVLEQVASPTRDTARFQCI